jgi:hypothetical protein
MGCGPSSESGVPATTIMLDGVDLDADVRKGVPDFKCLEGRLMPFDQSEYDGIVNSSSLYEDAHFSAGLDILLDKTMSH